jgi:hypothetical protein
MKNYCMLGAVCLCVANVSVNGAVIDVDLSGITAGTYTSINGVGADFSGTFSGQTIGSNTGISGSPTRPLTLTPANDLQVAFWSPRVSTAGNSILPQPNNQGPLSILLDYNADSITWTMGSVQPPSSVDVAFFDSDGNLVHNLTQSLLSHYNVYSFNGFGDFRGLTIFNNNDFSGLRYMNFSYNAVPIPATVWLFGSGLLGLIGITRRKKTF